MLVDKFKHGDFYLYTYDKLLTFTFQRPLKPLFYTYQFYLYGGKLFKNVKRKLVLKQYLVS